MEYRMFTISDEEIKEACKEVGLDPNKVDFEKVVHHYKKMIESLLCDMPPTWYDFLKECIEDTDNHKVEVVTA